MTVCIAGGGPAGMMLGYLLARGGIGVTVLEKHKDFLRDFRGDTVHPSTLELFFELGLLDEFLKQPHRKVSRFGGRVGDLNFQAADFSRLPTHCRFLVLMPQWDLLNFLACEARRFATFELRMGEEVTDIIRENGKIMGVKTGSGEVRADLTVACDGRTSTIRKAAGLEIDELGVPIDVLWFRVARDETDSKDLLATVDYGRMLILIDRGDYFQAGLIVRKGSFNEVRSQGLAAFQECVLKLAPSLGSRVREVDDWEKVKLLTVEINRLKRWHMPGLLCIGDAAHAMSPAGGVGINLAVQDAVATANILLSVNPDIARVQARREFPAKATQFLQANIHRRLARVFENPGPITAPWLLRAIVSVPGLPHLIGRAVGMGARPEHIRSRFIAR